MPENSMPEDNTTDHQAALAREEAAAAVLPPESSGNEQSIGHVQNINKWVQTPPTGSLGPAQSATDYSFKKSISNRTKTLSRRRLK